MTGLPQRALDLLAGSPASEQLQLGFDPANHLFAPPRGRGGESGVHVKDAQAIQRQAVRGLWRRSPVKAVLQDRGGRGVGQRTDLVAIQAEVYADVVIILIPGGEVLTTSAVSTRVQGALDAPMVVFWTLIV